METIAVRIYSLLFLFLMLLSESSLAKGVPGFSHGEREVSIFGGDSFIGESTQITPVEDSSQSFRVVGLSYGAGSQIGIRLVDNRWNDWGAALEYGFSNQPITFTNLSDAAPSLGLGHAIHRFSYDVIYYTHDRDHRLRPFVFAGPGVSLFYIKGSAKNAAALQGIRLNDPWKFTWNWGGGVKYGLKKRIALCLQFSDSISGVPAYGLPFSGRGVSGGYVPGFKPDGLMQNALISAAFLYQWDER